MNFDMICAIVSSAIFIAALIFIGIKFKQDAEPYYPLFMFLYYFIGSFKLNLILIPIPLGLIICLIYLSSHPNSKNRRAKKAAIWLGALAFLLGCIVPFARTQILTRTQTIKVDNWNIRNFSFTQEYNKIIHCLDSNALKGETPNVNSFEVLIDKDNNITNLSFNLTYTGDTYQDVEIESGSPKRRQLIVNPKIKTQSNNQTIIIGNYSTMQPSVNARMFFETLDKVTLNKLEYTESDTNRFTLERLPAHIIGQKSTAELYGIEGDTFHSIEDKGQNGNILTCAGFPSDGQVGKYKDFLLP